MKDYYKILGVKKNATFYDITKAYRELSSQFETQKIEGEGTENEHYNDLKEAFDILSNDLKRRQYDLELPKEKNFKEEHITDNQTIANTKRYKEEKIREKVRETPTEKINRDITEEKLTRKFAGETISENKSESIVNTDLAPTIEFFKSNKLEFNHDEEVVFRWKTNNADKVTLLPFGAVSPTEQKAYKINDFKSKYVTIELIAENTSTGKKAVSSVTLKNNFYDELFNFFKNELEKQYRNTAPLPTPNIPVNQNQRIPERPVQAAPKKEYQPAIPEYQTRTTAKKPRPAKEKGSSNVFGIIFKVFLYLFFLISLIALIYLGFFMN
ncbi:hypothetical protein BH23BAC1_BH23BAC1_29740 [soil metagenome]